MSSVKTKEHQATIKTLQDLIRANPTHGNGEILALARGKGIKTSVFVIAQTRRHMKDRGELKVKPTTNGAHPQPVQRIDAPANRGFFSNPLPRPMPEQYAVSLSADSIADLSRLAKHFGSWKELLNVVRLLALE